MSWSIGYEEKWKRDIGYGVVAICDHPECSEEIDRGLANVCANQEPRGGDGCGLYFCETHHNYYGGDIDTDDHCLSMCCERCAEGREPFEPKADHPMWTKFKMTDKSWRRWRKENGHPEPTAEMRRELRTWEANL